MNEYRYQLDPGSKKHTCPNCDKNTFVWYIDTTSGEYLNSQFGRCDRESNCKYHHRPEPETKCFFVPFNSLQDYSEKAYKITTETGIYYLPKSQVYEVLENGFFVADFVLEKSESKAPVFLTSEIKYYSGEQVVSVAIPAKPQREPVFIPAEVLNLTLRGYEQNTFIQNLLARVQFPFDGSQLEKIISLYYLGTVCSGYRAGAITFPFIDQVGNIRAIQVKQFDETNHTTGTDFLHSIIEKHHTRQNTPLPDWLERYKLQDKKVYCLFGEHLLNKYPLNPIALVEAPKTAIYSTLYFGFPDSPANLLWLAVYNLSSLTFDKCKVLKGRDVFLFPDLSKDGKAFELWSQKAKQFEPQLSGTRFVVSDLLEHNANEKERANGLDLADYLINQDWRNFQPQPREPVEYSEPDIIIINEKGEKSDDVKKTFLFTPSQIKQHKVVQFENWEKEINELETFFSGATIPQPPIKLNQCSTIINPQLFIDSHLAILKHYNGKQGYEIELNRLLEFKKVLLNI